MTFHIRTTCRLCDGDLRKVLDLGETPLANELVNAPGVAQDMYPLFASTCVDCHAYQVPVVVDPRLMFQSYAYVSGTSPIFREHLSKLSRDVARRLFPTDLIVEIGSNDGTLLDRFEPPLRVLGVDPARNLAEKATSEGILTYPGFLTPETARAIVRSTGKAKVVLALNVLAHADDLHGIAEATRELLAEDGELILEVAYLPDMLRDGTFDMHYLEHTMHWHLAPMMRFYDKHCLTLYDAEHVDTQGGSIRCYVSKQDREQTDRLLHLIGMEQSLVHAHAFKTFAARIATTKAQLTELLAALKAKGKRIAAFGCPAKATTLLHHFGIGRETIDYIAEENPNKVGKFSPGKHIPIVSVEKFRADPPDYTLILAWNFESNIRSRHSWFKGEWILPMPEVKVVER